jgi:hypothetical protein
MEYTEFEVFVVSIAAGVLMRVLDDLEISTARRVRRNLRRHLAKTRFLIATVWYVRMLAKIEW